jgi:hypothetical protein
MQGPIIDPTRSTAGQAVFSAVQKPPIDPRAARLSVAAYSPFSNNHPAEAVESA